MASSAAPRSLIPTASIISTKPRFYQASTPGLFGKVQEILQSETTPVYPRSSYAVASSTLIGSRSTTVKPMVCMPVMGFCLITSRRCAARLLSRARPHGLWRASSSVCKIVFISATSMPSVTGAMLKTMWNAVADELGMKAAGKVRAWMRKATGFLPPPRWGRVGGRAKAASSSSTHVISARALLGTLSKAKNKLGWVPKVTFKKLVAEMVREDMKSLAVVSIPPSTRHGYMLLPLQVPIEVLMRAQQQQQAQLGIPFVSQ